MNAAFGHNARLQVLHGAYSRRVKEGDRLCVLGRVVVVERVAESRALFRASDGLMRSVPLAGVLPRRLSACESLFGRNRK